MNVGRRLLAFLLAMSILFSTMPVQAFATVDGGGEGSSIVTEEENLDPQELDPEP